MPALIIHGGAGKPRAQPEREAVASALLDIGRTTWALLASGMPAVEAVVCATALLEDNPLFNAGRGSKLQCDGRARLSAALMDGERERFSGVVNAEGILNPIHLAARLQADEDRVLSGSGALRRARELGLAEGDVRTQRAIEDWEGLVEGKTGTVGAVALDAHGRIAAATSTGGRGMEREGRVSDSATVAGNFATAAGGVSCTGVGEDIMNGALASRLVTLLEAGEGLKNASLRIKDRMNSMGWEAGFIAIDRHGQWVAPHTTEIMHWAAFDEHGEHQFGEPK
jgi:L-asparaginase